MRVWLKTKTAKKGWETYPLAVGIAAVNAHTYAHTYDTSRLSYHRIQACRIVEKIKRATLRLCAWCHSERASNSSAPRIRQKAQEGVWHCCSGTYNRYPTFSQARLLRAPSFFLLILLSSLCLVYSWCCSIPVVPVSLQNCCMPTTHALPRGAVTRERSAGHPCTAVSTRSYMGCPTSGPGLSPGMHTCACGSIRLTLRLL